MVSVEAFLAESRRFEAFLAESRRCKWMVCPLQKWCALVERLWESFTAAALLTCRRLFLAEAEKLKALVRRRETQAASVLGQLVFPSFSNSRGRDWLTTPERL